MVHADDVKLKLHPKVLLKKLTEHEIRKFCFDHNNVESSTQQGLGEPVPEIGTHQSSLQNGRHFKNTKGNILKKIKCEPASNEYSDTVELENKSDLAGSKRISKNRKRPWGSSPNEESSDHNHTNSSKKVRLPNQAPSVHHQSTSTASVQNGENVIENGRADEAVVQSNPNGTTINENDSATNENISKEVRLSLLKDRAVEVHPDVEKHLKQHQRGGVHFIWNKLIRKPLFTSGDAVAGCILSQPSGLGKSAQVIAFLYRALTNENVPDLNTALILCRRNNIDHWMAEFSNWVPKEVGNNSCIVHHFINLVSLTDDQSRALQLQEWKSSSGVVICDYQMFQSLVEESDNVNSNVTYVEKILTPDILICDDGHSLLHAGTSLVQCLEKVKTKRKLFLTNVPIQNNLMEYHCIVSLVNKKLLGDVKEFRKRFVNPIENGQHIDSTESDVKLMKKRGYILKELLSECIQRKDNPSLMECIPRKYEYTIKVKLTQIQALLYTKYLTMKTTSNSKSNKICPYQDFHQFLLIVCHPRCLIMQKEMQDKDLFQLSHHNGERSENSDDAMRKSDDDVTTLTETPTLTTLEDIHALSKDEIRLFIKSKGGECPKTRSRMKLVNTAAKYLSKFFYKSEEYRKLLMKKSVIELKALITEYGGNFVGCTEKNDLVNMARMLAIQSATASGKEWFEIFLQNMPYLENTYGGKIILLLKILQESCRLGDKIVIFSQSLMSLNLIESVLQEEAKITKATLCAPFCKWEKNKDYFRIDGSIGNNSCSTMISHFNDQNNRRGRLLLVLSMTSHMIASLTGANRVILFDASWSPSSDIQAISKVYRLGQTKPCYIYRLLAHGTVEEKIYERNFVKMSLSYRTDIESRVPKHFTAGDIATLYKFEPKQEKSMLNTMIQDIVFSSLVNSTDYIASFHVSDTLADCQVARQLTEGERQAAWAEYRRDSDVKTLASRSFIRRVNSLPHHVLMSLSIQGSDLLHDIEKKIVLVRSFKQPLENMMMQTRMKTRTISTDQAIRNVIEQALNNHLELRRLNYLKIIFTQHLDAIQTAHESKSTNLSTPNMTSAFGRGGPTFNSGNLRPAVASAFPKGISTIKVTVPLRGGRAFRPFPNNR